jgi:hypothetical protein
MNAKVLAGAIAVTLLGSVAVLAQGQQGQGQGQQAPQHPMTFFVASGVPGTGNLGGLAGADMICQNLAQAAGAGNHTWHAYLSTQPANGQPGVNARGRIGAGPWYNAKGVLIAANVADLHGDQARDRNNIQKANALDEKGNVVKGFGDMPNEHDMLTGSDSDGRALPAGLDTTCNNWTSDGADHRAMLGHSDRSGGGNVSWNSAHMSRDCTKAGLVATGGAGHFYCFAIN